jgi:hypothetical protein
MIANPSFDQLLTSLDTFFAHAGRVDAAGAGDGPGQQLGSLVGRLRQAQARLQTAYPREVARLQQELAAAQDQARATQDQIARLKQQAAAVPERSKPLPAPPPPVEAAADPDLGWKLRTELLERFSRTPQSAAAPAGRSAPPRTKTTLPPDIAAYLRSKGVLEA